MLTIQQSSKHESALAVPRLLPRPALAGLTDLVLAFGIALAGLYARLYELGGKPFWLDEVTTLRRASLGTMDLITDSLSFHHLPLYFLISRWFVPLGTDEASLRLPAALFGALSCIVLFGLGRMIGGRRAAVAASLLLALSPFQVQYGQEARSYTLVICFILLALWALAAVLRLPTRVGRPRRVALALSTAAVVALAAVILERYARPTHPYDNHLALRAAVPAGACLVSSTPGAPIAADRLPTGRNCPLLVDPFGIVLAKTGGRAPSAAQARRRTVVRVWLHAYQRADFVYLQPRNTPQFPTDGPAQDYLDRHFHRLPFPGPGRLYRRVTGR